MPRAHTTKTVPFSTFKHPRPAPSPPSHSQSRSRFATSEGSLLRSHGLHVDDGGGFTYDHNAVFQPLKVRDKDTAAVCGEYIGLQRGKLRSWVWSWTSKKWVTLHEQYLCASNSKEDTEYTDTLPLNQVHELYPVESKRFCCLVRTPLDTWFLIFSDSTMFNTWMTEIHRRCPLLNISSPTSIRHLLHVTYNSAAGQINGLPIPWIKEMGLLHHASTIEQEAEIEEAVTPMTEPLHSPVQSSSSQSAISSPSPSQQRQRQRQRQQQQSQGRQLEEQMSYSMPTPAPTQNFHKRRPSHVGLNGSTGSASGSHTKSTPKSESESGPPPETIRTQQHHHHQHNEQRQRQLPSRPVLTSSASTSTFAQNGHAQQPEQQLPVYHSDLDARDLTGLVQTVHLLPIAQQDYWDTWKGRWIGQFGTRQVAIHVLRFTNSSDNNNNTPTNQNPSLNNPELVHKFTSILLNELRALHQLRHPNVVRIRGYTRDLFHTGVGGVPAVISTWTSDRNIMEYLNDNTSVVSPLCRLKLLAEAASGLSYLHTFPNQILHGSLRGCQILIQLQPSKLPTSESEREPMALITGFGFNPLLVDEDAKWALPNVTPSPRWAAPEVIFGGRKEMTDMADVFSFARCIVEVLTSQQPYPSIDSDADVLGHIVSSTSPSNNNKASVYYPKPRLRSRQQQQQQQRQRGHGTLHDMETIRTLQRLWPLLERCWRLFQTNRPSMENVRNGLLEVINNED